VILTCMSVTVVSNFHTR